MYNKLYISWSEFDSSLKLFAERIKQFKEVTVSNIYGIPRGGLMVAICLSHLLSLPIVYFSLTKDTLIIDDVIDTGRTLEARYSEGYKVASLYWCKESSFKPHIYVNQKLKNQWIVLPWEYEDKVI